MRLLNGAVHSNTAVLALLVIVLSVRRKQGEKASFFMTGISKVTSHSLNFMNGCFQSF